MSKLIKELEKDHLAITAMLSDVRKFGIDSQEGQMKLLLAKNGLLAHLKKEDEQLYPVLNKAASSDGALNLMLITFAQEMAEISKIAMEFFGKYVQGGQGEEFEQDFAKFYSLLSQRIKKEDIIYSKYEQVMSPY